MPTEESPENVGLKTIRAALPKYEVHEWRHAASILTTDFEEEWEGIRDVLSLTSAPLIMNQTIYIGSPFVIGQ